MKANEYFISKNVALFRSLLQPHFLFNSLNNLYALSVKNSDQTPEAIAGLSRLLEKVVMYSQKDRISLDEELQIICDYISLEQVWLGREAFQADIQVKGDTKNVMIPPLTIYTLIENAFKHGVRKCTGKAWISIYILVKGDKVLLKIRNSLNHEQMEQDPDASGCGLGMKAVKGILDDSYRKSYYFEARSLGDVYAVDLIIARTAA